MNTTKEDKGTNIVGCCGACGLYFPRSEGHAEVNQYGMIETYHSALFCDVAIEEALNS